MVGTRMYAGEKRTLEFGLSPEPELKEKEDIDIVNILNPHPPSAS